MSKRWLNFEVPPCEVVKGSSMTIPGLAPDLIAILSAHTLGEPLPIVGNPQYDESEEAGEARVLSSRSTMGEVLAFAEQDAINRQSAAATVEVPESVNAPGDSDND